VASTLLNFEVELDSQCESQDNDDRRHNPRILQCYTDQKDTIYIYISINDPLGPQEDTNKYKSCGKGKNTNNTYIDKLITQVEF